MGRAHKNGLGARWARVGLWIVRAIAVLLVVVALMAGLARAADMPAVQPAE